MSVDDILYDLWRSHGKLTAEVILDAATDPESPLHTHFEWDQAVAAHEYRLVQARELVRRAETVIMERPVRKFVFIKSASSYQPIAEAMKTKDWREEVLAEFRRDADRFEQKWANHKHVADHYRSWVARKAS